MDIDAIIRELKGTLLNTLGDHYDGFKKATKADLEAFLKASEGKLSRWTMLLANGDLSIDDYEWLVQSQKDLMEMKALQQMGISKISLGHFKNKVVKTLVGIIKGLLL
ncbi:MAG: hypothetical protein AAGF77_04150 [Bacteroidota bacterium]